MTDRDAFMKVVNESGKKMWEVSSGLGISPQALYNKLGNVTQFTQSEMAKFKAMFPNISDKTFESIFFANQIAGNDNE